MSLSSAQRRLGLVGGLVLVGILGLLILVSSPFFHNRLLGRGFAALEQQYGIVGHADELVVKVVGLDVRFRGLTLATRERPDEPFFTVDEARIDFPWSVLWSELSIQTLALVGPRVSVHTDQNGSSNLPSMQAASDNAIPSNPLLPIGDLAVEGLSVMWLDEARRLSVDVGPTTLSLAGTESRIAGPVNLTAAIVIDLDGDEARVTGLHGQLWFDGATLGIDTLRVESTEGVLTTSGEIGSLLSSPTLDLTVNSTLNLAPLAIRLNQDSVTGELTVVGRVAGRAGNPTAEVSVSSDRVSWNQLGIEALSGRLQVTTSATRVDALSMTLAEGTVSASGLVSFSDDAASSIDVRWDAVAAGVLLDSLERDLPSLPDSSSSDTVLSDTVLSDTMLSDTVLSGSMALEWTDLDPRSSAVTFRNLGSDRGRVGETRLVGRNGSYQLTVDQSFDGARLVGTIDGTAVSGSWPELSINGELEVACDDLSVCHAAFLTPPTESWVTDILGDLGGHVAAQLEVAGSLASPSVSGLVDGMATGVGHLAPMNLSLGLSGDVDRLELSSVEVRLGENTVRGEAEVVWESGALSGGFDGELTDLADFTPLVPNGWTTPSGAVRLETDLKGTLDAPRVDLISVDGSIALAPSYEGTPDELPVRANLDISASGALLPDVAIQGVLGTDELWWGEARLGPATVNFVYRDDATDVEVDLELPELATVGSVELSLQGERPFTGSLSVSPILDNLSRIGDAANLPLAGELFLDATFAGSLDSPDVLTAEIDVMLANGRFADQVPALTPRRATVRYGPDVIDVDQVAVQLGSSTVDVSGRLTRVGADTLSVGLRGAGEDLLALLAAVPGADTWRPDLDVKGLVTLDAVVSGWIDAPVIDAQLGIEEGQVATADHPPIDQLALQISYTEGVAEVEELSGRWQGASITGRGSLPLRLWAESLPTSFVETLPPERSASFRVGIESLTEDALVGYLDQTTIEEIEGSVNATIELEADQPRLDAVRASLTLEEAELTLSGVPLVQRRPTRLEIEGGRLRVGAFDWGNNDDYLTIGGEVDLGERLVADLTVTGEVDLRAFSAFLTPVVTEGDALLLANVRGPLDDPEITGTIELTNAGLRMAQPRMLVSDLNGALFLTRDTIQFHELIGEANGGRFQIEGELDLVGLRPEGTVLLVGRGIAMEVPEGVRTEVDTDLSLSLSADAVTLAAT